jgi:uncharacterized protein
MDGAPSLEDKAAHILQRGIRNYHFQANKKKVFEDMYRQGLLYRDGKEGYEKNLTRAGAHFLPLAYEGDVKAQHNLAMVYYQWGNYDMAYKWFKKAADQGFGVSVKNLKILIKEKAESLLRLPNELLLFIMPYLDNNSLLSLRVAAHRPATIVEEAFLRRASIKTSLDCLSSQSKIHLYPHTVSYFLRENLWKTKDSAASNSMTFLKCAVFSHEWDYAGEFLFRLFGDPSTNSTATQNQSFNKSWENIEKKFGDNTDVREVRLWFNVLSLGSGDVLNSIRSLLKHAKAMPLLERKNVACFYVHSVASYLTKSNQHTPASLCYEFLAAQGDYCSQHDLGVSLEKEGKIEEAKKFYETSIEQGNLISATNLGVLLEKEGNFEQAEKYYKLAAAQGDEWAQNNLGFLLRRIGRLDEAEKYYQMSADQGNVASQYGLGVVFHQKGQSEQARIFWKIAADRGHMISQHNVGFMLEKEEKIEEAKRYYQMSAKQGYADAQHNLGLLLRIEGKIEKAKEYYKMAADQGHVSAQLNLGNILAQEGSLEEAKIYWEMAASQGSVAAQKNLQVLSERNKVTL